MSGRCVLVCWRGHAVVFACIGNPPPLPDLQSSGPKSDNTVPPPSSLMQCESPARQCRPLPISQTLERPSLLAGLYQPDLIMSKGLLNSVFFPHSTRSQFPCCLIHVDKHQWQRITLPSSQVAPRRASHSGEEKANCSQHKRGGKCEPCPADPDIWGGAVCDASVGGNPRRWGCEAHIVAHASCQVVNPVREVVAIVPYSLKKVGGVCRIRQSESR